MEKTANNLSKNIKYMTMRSYPIQLIKVNGNHDNNINSWGYSPNKSKLCLSCGRLP